MLEKLRRKLRPKTKARGFNGFWFVGIENKEEYKSFLISSDFLFQRLRDWAQYTFDESSQRQNDNKDSSNTFWFERGYQEALKDLFLIIDFKGDDNDDK